ncbi:amino acid adenylation domain-containing protein [Bacillus cereus]|uniref:amino acid adenylation domain-containing protein n=1 Tax=Bacillus cereus TaxID=1396 RepID=UPI00187A8E8B|nr:non-ribosomal peptide synthetase [Bacillus cereus]MBE7122186.1 amino acid adenylation domain-containing protein [Bacillus cereus]
MNYLSKENVEDILELSLIQKSILSKSTLTQVVYELPGDFDSERLQQAWEETVAAHQVLRSVFRTLKNRTVQVILKQWPIPIKRLDLRGMEEKEQQTQFRSVASAHREPIQVDTGPLIRLVVCRFHEDRTILLWTHHSLCMDDNSRDKIVSEWMARVQKIPQTDLHYKSYRDYLAWEAGQDGMPAKEYWIEQMTDYEPTPMLQSMRSLSEERGSDLRCSTLLSKELSQLLEQTALRHQISVEAIPLAAWLLLLHVYSGEESVSSGAMVSGRPKSWEKAEVVGSFAHTLPIRTTFAANQQVGEVLTAVQKQWEHLQEFGHIPSEMIRTYVDIAEDVLLFDSSVTIRHSVNDRSNHPRLLSRIGQEWIEAMVTIGSRWEIELVQSNSSTLQDLERLQYHFVTLLESITSQPDAQLCELNLLSSDERQLLLVDFNQPKLAIPSLNRLTHQVIEEQVEKQPDAIAAICGVESITYRELNERSNRLAHWLREQGLGRDDLAALLAERSIEMLVSMLAVLKAGGAYLPLDSAHPDSRLITILENSDTKVILTESKWQSRSLELSKAISQDVMVFSLDTGDGSCIDIEEIASYSVENPAFINESGDLANVFFTSGSTGQPKGAMVEHIGKLNHLYAIIHLLGLNENSVVAQTASHCFDISVWQFLAPLMTGGQVVIYTNEIVTDPQALFHAVQNDHVTVLEMVPSIIEMFLQAANDESNRTLSQLQFMISTGEGLPVSLCHKWLEAYPDVKVVNAYGATECSDDTSFEVVCGTYSHDDHPQVALGTPIPNIHYYLLDAWQRPVPVGCVGEVYVTGIGVGRGYLNDPERTAHSFLRNPFADGMGEWMYKTGDLARFTPDGRLVFTSRADFQVKVRGYRIELGEIESTLLSHQAVSQCVALVQQDGRGSNRILVYTVLHEVVDVLELRQYLQVRLPEYMVPEHLIILKEMPLNRNGKIDRKALSDFDEFEREVTNYTAPRNNWETMLIKIWEEVLEVSPIGIDDNFFDLGGHSLKTIQIRSRIKRDFNVEISLKDLFDHQTICELAPILKKGQDEETNKVEYFIPRVNQAEFYPMSHAQQRMFLIHRLQSNNLSYNMPVAIKLTGYLNLKAFQKAFQSLLNRHEGLRTTFTVHDGQPVQRVSQAHLSECLFIDLSDEDGTTQQQRMAEIEQEEKETYFDLTTGPLFRMRLCKLASDHHMLWMNMHHIIGDYWSWQVLMRDFTTLYEAFCQGQIPSLPPLVVQYKDYASWQNERLERGELVEAECYWLKRFEGDLPILNMPTDYPRPPIQTFTGNQVTYRMDYEHLERIKSLAQELDATLFMVLLSAVGAFLSRMSGQQDIVIGTPEAGRDHVDLENLIGFFVNTLPLRLDLSANQTFTELVQHCKSIALDAYTYHEYPFDQLVEKLKPERDLSRSPIFSVMFQLMNSTSKDTMGELDLQLLPVKSYMTKFDITVVCIETESGLDIQFQYQSDLYEMETMNRWLEHFAVLIDGILRNPKQKVSELPLLNESQRRQLLIEWNDTALELPKELVHERFASIAQQMPEHIAVESDESTLTYRELDERSERLAHFLRRQGVGPDVLVGICIERTLDMMVGLLGILKAGGAYVPLDPKYPSERLAFLLDDLQASVLLTQEKLLVHLPSHEARVFCLDRDWSQIISCDDYMPQRNVHAEDLAYMIYTSGSTGVPKGVMIPHRGLTNYLEWALDAYEVEKGIGTIVSSSLAFDATITSLFTPLLTGGRVILIREGEEIEQLSKVLRKHQNLSLLKITPAHLLLLNQQLSPEDLAGRVRTVVIGGEALMGEDIAFWQQAAPKTRLMNEYGPTETVVGCSVYHVSEIQQGSVPIGRPIANMQIYILDSLMQPVPIGVPGELYIGGVALARGYHNQAELTEERFVLNPFSDQPDTRLYKTGDIARYLPNGNLEYLGRIDDQVKLRGYRIELGEIETVLKQHPAVSEATVILREDVKDDKRLVAYVTAAKGCDLTVSNVQQHLIDFLPYYILPSAVVVLDEFPLTVNGKLDCKQFPAPDAQLVNGDYMPPRDLNELQMVQIWEDMLNTQPIGIYDNFFTIGGNSLKALLLLQGIRERFGVELPLVSLFRKPTVAELCSYLQGETAENEACLIKLQQGDSGNPPLIFIHPQGGGVLPYIHLVKGLGTQETVYGLQAVGYESDEQPLTSIEEMASLYIEEIKSVMPQGPYRLVGWSLGGTVAYEMVRQLEHLGDKVEFIGLLDVQPLDQSGKIYKALTERDAMVYFATLFDLDPYPFSQMELEEGLELLLQQAKDRGEWPLEMTLDSMYRKIRVMVASGQAAACYQYRGPIQSNLHLFHVSELSKHQHTLVNPEEWIPRTTGEVIVFHVPGNHNTMALPPNVDTLTSAMKSVWAQQKVSEVT